MPVRKSRWATKRQMESCRWREVLVFWMGWHRRKVRAARRRHSRERLNPTYVIMVSTGSTYEPQKKESIIVSSYVVMCLMGVSGLSLRQMTLTL